MGCWKVVHEFSGERLLIHGLTWHSSSYLRNKQYTDALKGGGNGKIASQMYRYSLAHHYDEFLQRPTSHN